MEHVIVFDDGKGLLSPLTDFRPAFDIRTGALTTLDRFRLLWRQEPEALFVPEHLAALTRERHPHLLVNQVPKDAASLLLVNGRYAMMSPGVEREAATIGSGVIDEAGHIICVRTEPKYVTQAIQADRTVCPRLAINKRTEQGLTLLARPWHVRSMRDRCIAADLVGLAAGQTSVAPDGVTVFGDSALTIAPTAKVYPTVTIDLEHGPVFIAEYAVVRPGAILIGPCYVGPFSTVLERATIRPQTAIGPHCKVNGEIGGTIFQGFSNKAHDGYLGDSFVGEWVNLGAGTTNSNLLNTYGEIIAVAHPGASYEKTGEQFLGSIIGDHVKTAICTRLMTGSVLHTGSMFATSAAVSGCIGPFTWATDAGNRPYRLDKFTEVMKAAMGRRKIVPSAAYLARLGELHRLRGNK